jgi:CheY-like chemotaxis protein
LDFVTEMARAKGLSIHFNMETNQTLIEADPRRLKQILINLLTNAVKFTQEGSVSLCVRDAAASSDVEFSVVDTGIGIPEGQHQTIFAAFLQIESGDNRSFQGTGLGLALAARLATLHGGVIAVDSDPGKGSTFTVTMPWRQPSKTAAVLKLTEQRTRSKYLPKVEDSPLILVVDDNVENVSYMRDYLEFRGFQTSLAYNGREGVDLAQEIQPNAILMDIQMPVMDGLAAIKLLRAQTTTAHIPILALTARAMPQDREESLASGADAYLSKPVALDHLVEELNQLLNDKN